MRFEVEGTPLGTPSWQQNQWMENRGAGVSRPAGAEGGNDDDGGGGGFRPMPGGAGGPGAGQGLTLVHFSAQLDPCLSQESTLHALNTP